MKKIKNTNILFTIALLLGLLIHIHFVFVCPSFYDESCYASIPFRLINGDSLIQHEWHLTQFVSVFSYLPVYIWTAIKGSSEGMFVFLRLSYLLIHTIVAIIIYVFFRKHKKWAIVASMMFYLQIPYRIIAISYHSMFVVFLLLLTLCLLSIYKKSSARFYIFAGLCYGGCCVCNPLFCFAFPLYIIACALWTKRQVLEEYIIKKKTVKAKGKKLTKKQRRELKKQEELPLMENYNCFFTRKAILWSFVGTLIIAFVAVLFFFLTGGTIGSIFDNIGNLLGSSEYDMASLSVFSKIKETFICFSKANFGMPWILPLLYVIMCFDKNRKLNTHRVAYLTVLALWTIAFIIAVFSQGDIYLFGIALPFCIFSTTCYVLTEKKNKTLFYCMYVPSLIGTCFQYFAAETHLAVIGIVLAVNNVAGVFFAMDLWREMRSAGIKDVEETTSQKPSSFQHKIIIVGICLQTLFCCVFYAYGQVPGKDAIKATVGPYAGLYMTEEQRVEYTNLINDMDYIKSISEEDDPVLLAAYNNWMYIHLDRPIARYTTWYQGGLSIDRNQLIAYYKENPDRIPKYVYVEAADPYGQTAQTLINKVGETFDFTKEELSGGVLLTVTNCNF